jgi:hypothetical protein
MNVLKSWRNKELKNMEKPVSMIIEETKQSLADIINNCKLHPAIIEMIMKDAYFEICQFNAINTKREKEQFMKGSTTE